MKKNISIITLLTIITGLCLSFSACSNQEKLYIYNVSEYIDMDILKDFEDETGIKIVYETFDTNESMHAKISSGTSSYDIIVPSDYMVNQLISEDLIQKIDTSKLENYANIDESYKGLEYDPNDEYSVPYMTGTLGILYNKYKTKTSIDSWSALFDKKYQDDILMLDSERDALCAALKYLGYSTNTDDDKEIKEATDLLIKQKGIIRTYMGDDILDSMIGGEAAISLTYSGIAYAAVDECEDYDLEYVVPKEGSNKWVDALVIPKNAKNVDAAYKFIDYLCRKDVAAKNAKFICYTSPIKGIYEELKNDMDNLDILYPSAETLSNCETFVYNEKAFKKYNKAWETVQMSN
ncbi:MAG: spermidine/putrescine ABC transporter substrate-binding protein [Eubacteriales bacterium]|nr:spermidine/putrescine ABC transporter substrate-binding protein [Eubacteriales bacterium]